MSKEKKNNKKKKGVCLIWEAGRFLVPILLYLFCTIKKGCSPNMSPSYFGAWICIALLLIMHTS